MPLTLFTEIGKKFINFGWNHKRPVVTKAILNKRMNLGTMLLDFKIYYKAIVTKQHSTGEKKKAKKQTDQWNKNREPRNKFTYIKPADFQQRYQEHPGGKRQSSMNGAGKTVHP